MSWETRRIGSLGRVVTGKTPSTAVKEFFDGPFPFVTIPDMGGSVYINKTQRSLTEAGVEAVKGNRLPKDAVMMSCIATIGRCGITIKASVTNQQINSVICNADVNPQFLYYAFTQLGAALEAAGGGGSVFTNISKSRFENIEVDVPLLEEQLNIASVLGALDDKIELNRRMNATLEAMAQAVFKEWFLDKDIDVEGWELTGLGAVANVIESGRRPTGGVKGILNGVPSVGAESIVGLGQFDFSKTKYVPREYFESMNRGHVQDMDVLLYKDGGRPGLFEPHVTMVGYGFPFTEYCINEHVYRIRTEPILPQSFLYFWLASDACMEEMRNRGTGAAIPGLNSSAVRELAILKPSIEALERFSALVDPMLARILANCNESRTLAALRDTLLPKLMRGEVRVKGLGQSFGIKSKN